MTDHEAVLQANQAFYHAFESLEIAPMERVWLRDQRIACVHPGWRRLTGWGPIMESWERIFDGVFEMKFELNALHLIAGADLGVVVTEENLTQRGYDGTMRTQVLATNIYERVGNK